MLGQHLGRVRLGRVGGAPGRACSSGGWADARAGRDLAVRDRTRQGGGVRGAAAGGHDSRRRRPVHEILAEAKRLGAPVFYPLDRLLEAKRVGQPYYQTDTHWNQSVPTWPTS